MRTRSTRPPVRTITAIGAAALLVVASPAVASAASHDASTVAVGSAAGAPATATQVQAPVPELAWAACEGVGLEAFECASAEVPTDYDEPTGATTTIALTRLPATDPAQRIGSLFLNFGGPGGPGVSTLQQLGAFLDPQVHARFDVVGFDPRGVGASDPVTCFPDAASEEAFFAQSIAIPRTPEEEATSIAQAGALALACETLSGSRIDHASTANVARDMDLLRQAVGDERLSYLGYSYGSILGATYGMLFPDRVRALAIDGTLEPSRWSGGDASVGVRIGQGPAAAEVFDAFLDACAAAGPTACSLAATGDPRQAVDTLLTRLQQQPVEVPLPDGTTMRVDYGTAVAIAFQSLYSPAGFGPLADSLTQLLALTEPQQAMTTQQRGVQLSDLGDWLRELGLLEDYSGAGAALAAMCVDGEHPLQPWDYPAQADAADAEAPHFGRLRAWVGIQCEVVDFVDDDAYLGPWDQTTQAPVLVIGTRFDPATPYDQTQPYADRFPSASVLTVEGYGHTTLNVSSCANAAIATYLATPGASVPTTCEQDVLPFQSPADAGLAPLHAPSLSPGI
ncbi:alpha/beta fold hydrolase [Agrococcus sp. SGAir0287]|uniref:alpha/beta fold hydrolase n=1 Tax=Agrococcus sp. SGAir0287 TaxID=2070347 RepID=UPI0010CCF5BC|nr:alpha/beta fold hydrolase [Agrococcus sp. SGAir0287]QCR19939.1 alpha/beta hydrolase [Agrococcus sp. SGAir0287]